MKGVGDIAVIRVEHGDMLGVVQRLVAEGVVVDAIVTDPPYHLSEPPHVGSGGFGGSRSAERKAARAGFMAQGWDGGDVAFRPETWATLASVLRPGGFLLAFGGTRTHHRVWCAIEDGGFVIQDTIMWLFGSGFPKHRSHLKPAFEPICVAYKPGGKRTLQVDECRIPTSENDKAVINSKHAGMDADAYRRPEGVSFLSINPMPLIPAKAHDAGRWPSNVIHDGSDEVMDAFGEAKGGGDIHHRSSPKTNGIYGAFSGKDDRWMGYGDTGSAARFFCSAKQDIPCGSGPTRFRYLSKAGAQDRWGSKHPTVKPVELIKYLVKLVCPPGGLFLDPFAGSGTAAVAALATGRDAILIEQDAGYISDIRERVAFYQGEGRHSMVSKNRNRNDAVGTLL